MALIDNTAQGYYEGGGHGDYQFVSINDMVNNFLISYVGEGKIIDKVGRSDILFHTKRAIQELSYDTLPSLKSLEIEIPSSLTMILPQDYVNYVKLSWSDSAGIEHIIYPASKTSNPTKIDQNEDGSYIFDTVEGTQVFGDEMVQGTGVTATSQSPMNFFVEDGTATGFDETVSQLWNPVNENTGIVSSIITDAAAGGFISFNASQTTVTFAGTTTDIAQITYDLGPMTDPTTKLYKVVVVVDSWTEGDIRIYMGDGTTSQVMGITGAGTYTVYITPTALSAVQTGKDLTIQPTFVVSDYNFTISNVSVREVTVGGELSTSDSTTWDNYKSTTPSENNTDDYEDDTYWPNIGQRYGLEPGHSQINGSFYIDNIKGNIHFSSNISGKTVILKYITDRMGTGAEGKVHKFAEEAVYKYIIYAVLSTKLGIPEYIVQRFRKERFAAKRQAKLRLSNIKIEELTQIMRGKSKQIKH